MVMGGKRGRVMVRKGREFWVGRGRGLRVGKRMRIMGVKREGYDG